jgi:hypothetical protein
MSDEKVAVDHQNHTQDPIEAHNESVLHSAAERGHVATDKYAHSLAYRQTHPSS